MSVEKIGHVETYKITNETEWITAEINIIKGEITIHNEKNSLDFTFLDCDPERAGRIRQLIVEAANVAIGALLNATKES